MITITSRFITSQRIASSGRFLHLTPVRKSGQEEVRVRFAPSPTGHLHLGGLRTAFYNYVFARQNKGKFLLRIEDTDQTRIVPGSAETIEATLEWAGLEPDESPLKGGPSGPYLQSERLELYKQHAQHLLDEGKAYKCFCSPTRLDLLRKHQARNNEPIRYDGKCKSLTPSEIQDKGDESHCVRFPLQNGPYSFDDLIFGQVGGNLLAIRESDPIILKSDGYPTYHFACVVDDHLMRISHVLRGSEWLSSCAKHLQLYEAFSWQPPKFAHFPLITMQDGSKMSKRNDSSQVNTWIEAGYQPATLLNFLTQSGGGVPKSKQDSMEFWTLEQLVSGFDFKQVTCHPSSLDLNRLHVYSARELQLMWASNPSKVLDQFKDLLRSQNLQTDMDDAALISVIDKLIDRLTRLKDLLANEHAFIWAIPKLSFKCEHYTSLGWNLPQIIAKFGLIVDDVGLVNKEEFSRALKKISTEDNLNYAKLMGFMRRILTDCDRGLPVYEICTCLGEARLKLYLESANKYVSGGTTLE